MIYLNYEQRLIEDDCGTLMFFARSNQESTIYTTPAGEKYEKLAIIGKYVHFFKNIIYYFYICVCYI